CRRLVLGRLHHARRAAAWQFQLQEKESPKGQRGVQMLKEGGYHGHIVPTTILNNVYAESLRRWLTERCCIQNISVARGRVFANADVHTPVLILRRERDSKKSSKHEILTTANLSRELVKG